MLSASWRKLRLRNTACAVIAEAISGSRSESVTERARGMELPSRVPSLAPSPAHLESRWREPKPMQSEARRFLETLFACKPDDLYVLLWTLPEKQSHWFRQVHDAIQFAESLREHDL